VAVGAQRSDDVGQVQLALGIVVVERAERRTSRSRRTTYMPALASVIARSVVGVRLLDDPLDGAVPARAPRVRSRTDRRTRP
jgi:hypothetical protein